MRRRFRLSVLVPCYLGAIFCLAYLQNQLQQPSPQQEDDERKEAEKPVEKRSGLKIMGETNWTLPTEEEFKSDIIKRPGKPKEILIWSGSFSQAHLGGCPSWNCIVTSDKSKLNSSGAVIFYNGVGKAPTQRRFDQYFVFFTQESPHHMGIQEPYSGFFNLTMGFRRDADLPCPYGYTVERTEPLSDQMYNAFFSIEKLAKKSKSIAWFVSNCGGPSQRKAYVEKLQEHIPVDIYGACGKLSCPKNNVKKCLQMLSADYYFYLALENSICKDYITEKFWEKGAQVTVVPIVLKRSIVEPYAPSKSFIAVDDFNSPKELADYLQLLIHNPEAYAEYFHWRRTQEIVFLDGNNHDRLEQPWGFCRLCDLLWKDPLPEILKPSIKNWWMDEAHCDTSLVSKLLS